MDPLLILAVGMAVVVGGVLLLRLHAFLALILGALTVGLLTPADAIEKQAFAQLSKKLPEDIARKQAIDASKQNVGDRIASGFGKTCIGIGILIAMASIIGQCLLESGGADRIVRSTLWLLGESRRPLAFLISGFILGIPVFFDTVFLLMIPLGKAMTRRTGKNYLLYVLSIVAGATMTHSLVPPTPGPLAVAQLLKVDIGLMILGGCIVGVCCSAAGYCWALYANRRLDILLRDDPGKTPEVDEASLPPLGLSLLPILLPVLLISGASVLEQVFDKQEIADSKVLTVLMALGNKNLSIVLAAGAALYLLARRPAMSRERVGMSVSAALADAGVIILITSAGGAFGDVLQQSGIGGRIQELADVWKLNVIVLAWLVTVLIRTAQGSATVAMITAGGIFAGQADAAVLGFHPLYLALAIGCGSKPFPWMNDSGFWVICKMSGLTEKEGLRAVTPLGAIMGSVGLIVTLIGARLFPLV